MLNFLFLYLEFHNFLEYIFHIETQVENLSNELENARKELQMAESRVQEILCSNQEIQRNADIKLQVNLENVNNLTEELTKLNAENKVLMKHDQVFFKSMFILYIFA